MGELRDRNEKGKGRRGRRRRWKGTLGSTVDEALIRDTAQLSDLMA